MPDVPVDEPRLTSIDVACLKWGPMYTADEVNRLHAMVVRHLPAEVTFHCVTDDATGLDPSIRVHDLEPYLVVDWDMGVGRKLCAFSRDFIGLEGAHVVFIDIDMVVIDDLGFLLERPDEDFIVVRGHNQYGGARPHMALYRHRIGSMTRIWDDALADPAAAIATCQHHRGAPGHINDQSWLDLNVPDMAFFPDGVLAYYRQDCGAQGRYPLGSVGRRLGLSTALWGVARPPVGTRVVSFAGRTNPGDVADHHHHEWRRAPFVKEHWHV
jgi:hypothetical protein